MTQVLKSSMTIKEINESLSFGGLIRKGVIGQFLILSDCDEMETKYFYAVRFQEVYQSASKEDIVNFARIETKKITAEALNAMPKINASKLTKAYQLS